MGRPLGGGRHLPLRPHRRPRPGLRIDTPPPTVSGSLHVGHVFSLHPHRHHRPLPAHAGQAGLLPDGLGRQRAAHRAPGAELLRRPLRPVAALRPRLRPAGEAAVAGRRHLPAQLRRALRAADRRGREGLRGAVAAPRPVGRLDDHLHDDRRAGPAGVAAGVPAPAGEGAGLPGRGARRCGTSTSRPPSPRPSWRTASSPAPTTGCASAAPTAGPSRSTPPAPS